MDPDILYKIKIGDIMELKYLYFTKNELFDTDIILSEAIKWHQHEIVSWQLQSGKLLSDKHLKEIVLYSNTHMFDLITTISDINELFDYALSISNLPMVEYIYEKGAEITKTSQTIALLSGNIHIIHWMVDINNKIDNKIVKYLHSINCDKSLQILGNYYITKLLDLNKSNIIIPLKDIIYDFPYLSINSDNLVFTSNYFIRLLILTASINNHLSILNSVLQNDKIIDSDIMYFFDTIINNNDNLIPVFHCIFKSSWFKKWDHLLIKYITKNLPFDIQYNLLFSNNLIVSLKQTDDALNKPLIHDSWMQVFEEGTNIMYKTCDNYIFCLEHLIKYWNTSINSYNYKLCPKYPNNIYTRSLFDPIEIYKIIIECSKHDIKIPIPILCILFNPYILHQAFICDDDQRSDYLINSFRKIGLKYVGGDSSVNEPGFWILEPKLLNQHTIACYSDINVPTEFIVFCLIKYCTYIN